MCCHYRWTTFLHQAHQMPLDCGLLLVSNVFVYKIPEIYSSPDNYPEPFKRPLSSTCPTIIEDESGDFYLAIGGSGGSKIFPAVFQTLLNMDWGQDVGTAIEYGRLHDQLFPEWVEVDDVYPTEIVADLAGRGHNITS